METEPQKPGYTFPRTHRVRLGREFEAVYGAKAVKQVGPLRVFGKPNGLPHSRLGLSVSRKVGKAVVRNRIKRLLRESYRLLQHDLPRGYDWVVVVRPHETMALADYQRTLRDATEKLERHWQV